MKVLKSLRAGLALLMVGLMMLSSTHSVSAASFSDVSSFKEEIEYLTDAGIINGFPDGTYRPSSPILRVQAVMMIMRDLGMPKETPKDPGFVDIKPADRGYAEVAAAVELGIISGKEGNRFDPQGKLTRAEMAKILVNAYELGSIYPKGFKDVPTK
ncbi:S-layer homology domain-containing protein, partial [Leptospira santarosai]|nr:S-layer homology domain-containing protein [Leptospira santarosai]